MGMTIAELDKNMAFKGITSTDLVWYDRYTEGFSFDGCGDLEMFHRIDAESRKTLPYEINESCRCTGITLRFRSDAKTVAIKSVLWVEGHMPIMALAGSNGFELTVAPATDEADPAPAPTGAFVKIFTPNPYEDNKLVCGEYALEQKLFGAGWHEFELAFPLYNGVLDFELGLNEGAHILPPTPLKEEKPIVFYGSSITQGASATKPCNCYTSMLAREMRLPQINLGFSGRAKGEPGMARYIAGLPMCAFVMDYDHNADTAADLRATHEPFFRIIREANPTLPILIVSRPSPLTEHDRDEAGERFEVLRTTYRHAVEAGDKHVYLLNGTEFFEDELRYACTADTCHPTDLGFYRMYKHIRPVLEQALNERE